MKIQGYRTWAEIDLKALRFNLQQLRSLHPQCEVVGVVKANAYGHGVNGVAQTLARAGVRNFAVANITEAEELMRWVPKCHVLLLGPLLPEEVPTAVRERRWIPTLSSVAEFQSFEKALRKIKGTVKVHIKVDTGMGRLGALPDEALLLCQKVHASARIQLDAIYTHFSSADESPGETRIQVARLKSFCLRLKNVGIHVPKVHFQNSAGAIAIQGSGASWIRPGLALYGVPVPESAWRRKFGDQPLKPVLSWKTRVVLIRDFPKGSTLSYCMTFRTPRSMKVAVLSVGYADGVYRKLSNRGEILIRGCRCRILGRVTMDLTMVDVSKVKGVRWGDEAVLIGRSGERRIRVEEVAAWAETNPYETLCAIGRRVVRIPREGEGAHAKARRHEGQR